MLVLLFRLISIHDKTEMAFFLYFDVPDRGWCVKGSIAVLKACMPIVKFLVASAFFSPAFARFSHVCTYSSSVSFGFRTTYSKM